MAIDWRRLFMSAVNLPPFSVIAVGEAVLRFPGKEMAGVSCRPKADTGVDLLPVFAIVGNFKTRIGFCLNSQRLSAGFQGNGSNMRKLLVFLGNLRERQTPMKRNYIERKDRISIIY